MKINKVKIKNAEGGFEEHEIGVDANNILFSTTENAEQVIAAQNNNTSELDLQYQILEKEYNTLTPIEDYDLIRNIDEFEARPYDDTISKIKVAKIKKSDGSWEDGIELEVKSTGVALNNNKDAEAEIAMLKSKVAALENIEKTLTSKISQQTEEGKNLSIVGIDEDKDYDFKILGESKQEQYEGYNLLDCDLESEIINGIEIKKNANGSYTLNGTATVNTNIVWTNKPFTLESGTYYIGLLEEVSNFNLCLALGATEFDILGQPASQKYFTRTLTETKNYVSLSSYIDSGLTINNLTLYPMISKDESKMSIKTFEPYTGGTSSPNPKYPQEIKSAGDNGNINEVIYNKNLFDKNKCTKTAIKEDGTTYSSSTNNTSDFIPIDINKSYYLPPRGSIRGKYYNKNKQPLNIITYNDFNTYSEQQETILSDIPLEARYIRITISDAYLENYYVIIGTEPTSYKEHQEQTISVPVQKPFRSIGETRDEFIQKGGKWFERHYIGKVVLDGSENITINQTGTDNQYFKLTISNKAFVNNDVDLKNICSHYTSVKNIIADYKNGKFTISSSGDIILCDTRYASLTKFQTWLYQNNVTVDYILATPEDIECTEEQIEILNQLYDEILSYNTRHIILEDELGNNYIEYYPDYSKPIVSDIEF